MSCSNVIRPQTDPAKNRIQACIMAEGTDAPKSFT